MSRYRYVSLMGDVYRLTSRRYKQYLIALSNGEDCQPEDFGAVLIGTPLDVTDLDEDDLRRQAEEPKNESQ